MEEREGLLGRLGSVVDEGPKGCVRWQKHGWISSHDSHVLIVAAWRGQGAGGLGARKKIDKHQAPARNQGRVCVMTERMTLLGHRFERRTAVGSKTGDASMDARLWLARNSRAADSGQCVSRVCCVCAPARAVPVKQPSGG